MTIIKKYSTFSYLLGVALGWERGKAEASSSALLSKKGVRREGSIGPMDKQTLKIIY